MPQRSDQPIPPPPPIEEGDGRTEGAENKPEEGKHSSGGLFGTILPPDPAILAEARRLIADRNSRVEKLAVCAAQDPVVAMELLRVSNAMFFAGGKSSITTMKAAIVRLGSEVVIQVFNSLAERPQLEDEDIERWVNVHRSRCKRQAILAKIIGEAVARPLSDDCEIAALFMSVGEILAVLMLKSEYVKLAEELSHSGVNYKLIQDYKFDVERAGLNYLRRQGIPEALLFAIDREAPPRSPDRVIMKPICASAGELIEAFDTNRWEKLAPGKKIPPKSAIRLLQVSDSQYLRIYERASEYLFGMRVQEERLKQEAVKSATLSASVEFSPPSRGDQELLQSEIQDILSYGGIDISSKYSDPRERPGREGSIKSQTEIKSINETIEERNEIFRLETRPEAPARIDPREVEIKPPPRMLTPKANKAVSRIADNFVKARNSEELLSDVLQQLIGEDLFEKSALIVVSQDRKQAIVVAARGPNITNGQRISIEDPLSPLAQCFSKVQSFGNRENESSPWGSRAFALAPVDADHQTPVALYADCGSNGAITFEARRIFRTVIDILNNKLPTLPGGIPVEL